MDKKPESKLDLGKAAGKSAVLAQKEVDCSVVPAHSMPHQPGSKLEGKPFGHKDMPEGKAK